MQGYQSNVIAAGAGEYLEGLGDYEDHTGVNNLLRFTEPNEQGHYGRATAQTHGLYETLPAPAIFYRRVVEDVTASQRGHRPNNAWIDDAIVPHLVQVVQPAPAVPPQAARQPARNLAEAGPADPDEEGGQQIEDEDANDAEEEEAPPPLIQPTVNLLGWRPSLALNARPADDNSPETSLHIKRLTILFDLK